MKDDNWVFYKDVVVEKTGEGVERRILAYNDELMIVENSFEKGAVGSLHSHPHTQITYVLEGEFEFEINGTKKIVKKGDSMLKKNGIIHGCVCLEKGKLLDIFTPMRKDFIK